MWKREDLVKPNELAEAAGLSIGLIRRLMSKGELKVITYSPKVRRIVYGSWLDYQDRNTS